MTVYREAGVDIDAAARARQLMAEAVRSTYSAAVLAGMGRSADVSTCTPLWGTRPTMLFW